MHVLTSWIVGLLTSPGGILLLGALDSTIFNWFPFGIDIPHRRLEAVRKRVRRTGALALAVLDLIPPPFPFTPFVLAAGALGVRTVGGIRHSKVGVGKLCSAVTHRAET